MLAACSPRHAASALDVADDPKSSLNAQYRIGKS
jgi:hypothetical protein